MLSFTQHALGLFGGSLEPCIGADRLFSRNQLRSSDDQFWDRPRVSTTPKQHQTTDPYKPYRARLCFPMSAVDFS